MTRLLIFICIISFCTASHAQEQEVQDTIKRSTTYGLRFGVDVSKLAYSYLDADETSFEIIGDFGFKPNFYAAIEMGLQEKTNSEDFLNYTTKGSYIKIGVNYNAYDNWIGMENEIFLGIRYGMSFFSQTLNTYTPNARGTYFIPMEVEPNTEFSDLSAQWVSFILGLKVETINNLYLGFSLSVNRMVSIKDPDNFKSLYVPGFNRVFSNNLGAGFNYSISYFIPLLKKEK